MKSNNDKSRLLIIANQDNIINIGDEEIIGWIRQILVSW